VNPTTAALADRLAGFDALVEVGVGRRTDLARALADAGARVTATDIHARTVPANVSFERDDLTDPDHRLYAGADAVYARNLPRELHRPARAVAREAGAAFLFTTLGSEFPAVDATPETLPGETLYAVTTDHRTPAGERRRA
jgi:uncharacterized protein